MKQKLNALLKKAKNTLFEIVVYTALVWIVCVFLFQLLLISLQLTGNEKLALTLINGDFQTNDIWVQSVENKVKIGNLAGNRNLEFGVRNVLEEYLQESGYELNQSAEKTLKVEIIFLDVVTIKQNISVLHKNEESVVIRLRGTLYEKGKKIKTEIVEESSSEISMSAVMIDGGGKFNQQSLSSALKKGCGKLITKLTN